MVKLLLDIRQNFMVDQTKSESVAALCQLPGVQGTETARVDELVAMGNIAKALVFPVIYEAIQIFVYNSTNRTSFALACSP